MPDPLTLNMRKQKSALTRAKKTGDPENIVLACDTALASFNTHGWPDCWSLWEREKQDAMLTVMYGRR